MKMDICVPTQLKKADLELVRATIRKIKQSRPQYIEFRLDYINDASLLSSSFLKQIIEARGDKETRVVFTFRKTSEGGQNTISEVERLKLMKKLIQANPDYVDVEMSSDDTFIRECINLALQNNVNLIFSHHDFERTPLLNEITDLIADFDKRLVKDLSSGAISPRDFSLKLVFTARNFQDNLVPIQLCQELSKGRREIISFCMGELGIFSRVSCVKYGSLFTFASLGETTAPGQISIEEIREAHRILYGPT